MYMYILLHMHLPIYTSKKRIVAHSVRVPPSTIDARQRFADEEKKKKKKERGTPTLAPMSYMSHLFPIATIHVG